MDPADRFSAPHRDLLLELSLLIGERRGIAEIYAAFADQIRLGITFDSTSLFVATPDRRFIRSVAQYPPDPNAPPGTIFRADVLGADLVARALTGSEYIPRKLDLRSTKTLAERGYERGWATPLIVDDVNYGMLTVAKREHGAFPADHIEFLRSAASLLAKAVREDLELESARRSAARAQAASELIFALQSNEPFDTIFQRLPTLLEDALEVDYVGLVIDRGQGFVLGAETPAGVHTGNPASDRGNAFIRKLGERGNFIQFKPEEGTAARLIGAGYERGGIAFLRDGDELRGLLMLARRSIRQFDEDERMFIELLRSILSQSLANQHRMARTEAAAARARTLNEVALLLNAGESIETIFQSLLGLMEQALEADYIGLLEATNDPSMMRMVGSRPLIMRESGALVPMAELGVEELVAAGRLTFQYRLASLLDKTPFNMAAFELGMRRAAALVVQQDGEVEGVLTIARKNEARFTQDEENFLETLCAMLGQAIAGRRRILRAEADSARTGLLNNLAVLLNNGEPPAAFFHSLSEHLQRVVPFDALVLYVTSKVPGEFVIVDSTRRQGRAAGETLSADYFGKTVWERAAAGETVIEGHLADFPGPMVDRSSARGVQRGVIAFIQHEGETVGVLLLGRNANEQFSHTECSFIELVSVLVGQAISNRRKVEEREAEAIRSQVLSELAVLLQGGDRITGHFDRLAELLLQAVGFDFISVTTRDVTGGSYEVIRSHELRDDDGHLLTFDPESIAVVARGERKISDYATGALVRSVPRALHALGFERAVSALIVSPEGEEGLLTIGRRQNAPFSTSELGFIELVAAMLGQASANYQKAYARDAEALRSRILSELAVLLNNGEPLSAHFERLREMLIEGVGFDFCSIAVRSQVAGGFRVMRSTELYDEHGHPEAVNPANIETILAAGWHSAQYGMEAIAEGAPSGLFRAGITRAASFVLLAGQGPEGLLSIGRRAAAPFAVEEMSFFEVVATLLGHAAANERRLALTTAEAREQALVATAAAAVARETGTLAIVRSLRQAVASFISQPFVNFGYLDDDRVTFPARTEGWVNMPIGPRMQLALEVGQATVPKPADRPGEFVDRLQLVGLQEHIVTRATSGGATVGLLVIGSRDPQFVPGEAELRLCRLIADIVGPAMANARAVQRERQEADEQRVVAEVASVAAREAEPGAMVDALRAPLSNFVPRPFVVFAYREGDEVTYHGPDNSSARSKLESFLQVAERDGQVHSAELPDEAPADSVIRKLGVHAFSATAVQSGGSTVGFLIIASREEGYVFTGREMRTFRVIAQIVGPAMENARAAQRARLEAEEQRILADAGAAVASARDEAALSLGLRAPIRMFIPESRVLLIHRDGPEISVLGTNERFPIGPQISLALAGEQTVSGVTPEIMLPSAHALMDESEIATFVNTPITSEGETLGVLCVATKDSGYQFSPRDLRLMRLIAAFAGPAMANLRESARRRTEAEEQRILADAAAAIASAPDEGALMVGLRAPIRMIVPAGRVSLFYYEGGHMSVFGTNDTFEIGPSITRTLAGEQVAMDIDAPEILDHSRSLLEAGGARQFSMTPIVSGGETLGILYVGIPEDGYTLSERELRLLRLIAGFAGPAMANLRESARRAEEAEDQRILAEAAAALAAGASETEILTGMVKPIRKLIHRARVAFSYVDGEEMWLWDGRNRRPIHGNSRLALDTGQAVGHFETTVTSPQSRDLIASAGVAHWVDTVATSAGEAVGLLFVGTPEPTAQFGERTLRVLRLIADMAGPAMVNARENARRRRESEDERILVRVAALAARSTSSSDLIDSLHFALEPLVPSAFVLYGFIEGEYLTYQVTRPEDQEVLGATELTLPLTDVGRQVREIGQSAGTLAGAPPDRPWAGLKLQEYSLTGYASSGAPLGVLLVSTTDPNFHFDDRSNILLRRIAQVVGPAVESSRAEAERARQAELYSLMLRSLSEGVVLSDVDGRVVFANRLGRRILHALDPAGSAEHWTEIAEVIPEEIREGYRAVYERGIGSRGRAEMTVDGEPAWFDYELVPLNDPVMKILLVAADVTADVQRETEQERHREQIEQSQRLAALGELIGGVAHELNNPLTAILGFAEVMALSPHAPPFKEEIGILQKEAIRARNIVRDLLFIVRPGTSERMEIPVPELVAHIERLRRTAWLQQGIEWEIAIDEPCVVWGNEHQLTQVLLNLVTNAEQALTGVSARRIAIRAAMREGQTEITVSDTGAGMDDATRSRVFEPFFTTKQGHGTGLGLSLSYSIVQSHGGEIRVETRANGGATFTILLPTTDGSPAAAPPAERPARSGVVRVLVVDDEASLRKVCQRLITSMGHECATAETSAEAIALAEANEFDVVLCDYRLASETANDVIAGFERVAPHLIPRVIIATGATTDAGVVELTERHGLRLMAKPYGVDELTAVIQ